MRAQEAATDPQQQVKEAIGSGPFKFAKEQWVPGSKAVYLKYADYVPRPGARKPRASPAPNLPGVDRIELAWIWTADRHVGTDQRRDRLLRKPNIDFYPSWRKPRASS